MGLCACAVPDKARLGFRSWAAGKCRLLEYVGCSSDIYHFDIYAMGPWSTPVLGGQQQRYKLTPERESNIHSGRWQAINAQQQMENNKPMHVAVASCQLQTQSVAQAFSGNA